MRRMRTTAAHHSIADRLAGALATTTDRYIGQYMAYATWREHMGALWRRVEALGLLSAVSSRVPEHIHLTRRG